ncbi:pentatricopeptide repeat-containing protein At1g33350-like [Neltuma alba]|uniref:pentatricopeptide repeat-containing protein At1g33350-like n=1 Tax=Neltuma alba TaxID=207710 RepID=UPI0010A46BB4|nr:pentatricopeptide repeat-containing protein At1g33350-like [Prosopis alba]
MMHDHMNLNEHVLSLLAKSNHLGHLKQLQGYLTSPSLAMPKLSSTLLSSSVSVLSLSFQSPLRSPYLHHLKPPNAYLYTAMITAYASQPDYVSAFTLFRDMPNQVTVVCALSACGHTGMLQLGKWIHGYLYKNGFVLDSFTSNALVDMYGKCGNLEQARKVFEMNPEKGLTSWNSMINSFALHGQSDSAIAIFEQMMECGEGV